jgi:hypothetical protein
MGTLAFPKKRCKYIDNYLITKIIPLKIKKIFLFFAKQMYNASSPPQNYHSQRPHQQTENQEVSLWYRSYL